jgi:MFS superfamily sulfate permease-like transporter
MIVSERIDGRIPAALIGIAIATLLVIGLGLASRGVSTLGPLPGGFPQFALPALEDVRSLVPLALIVSLVIMIQTAAVSQSFKDPGREPDVDRDYMGIGAGNLMAGALGTFPVDASPPRTAVAVSAGATSQLSALVAATLVLVLLFWGGDLFVHVPQAALAGVLLFVAQRLIHAGTIVRLAREAPMEGLLGLATAAAIVALPIQIGVTIGIGLSLLHGVWMTTQTRPVEMRRLPGTTVWWAPDKSDDGETVPGVAVIAFQAPLLFANADTFKREMIAKIAGCQQRPHLVVLEAGGIADIDFTAAEALTDLIQHCRRNGIEFAIARLESTRAQAALVRFGTQTALGPDRVFYSVEDAIRTHAQ